MLLRLRSIVWKGIGWVGEGEGGGVIFFGGEECIGIICLPDTISIRIKKYVEEYPM
jgi:hypothetical protein